MFHRLFRSLARRFRLRMLIVLGVAVIGCTFLPPPTAMAAGFDCAKAASSIEQTICASPELSKLDDEHGQKLSDALAASLDPQTVRTDEAEWLRGTRQHAADNGGLTKVYTDRLQALDDLIGQQPSEAAHTFTLAAAKASCLPLLAVKDAVETCTAEALNQLGAVDGRTFYYGRYHYVPSEEVLQYVRIVVFEQLASGALYVVLAPQSDPAFEYDAPKIIRAKAHTLLEIPALDDGSGFFNRESLFNWHDGHWNDVDVTSWLDDLNRRLPKGLGAIRGIYPDYRTMRAYTPIWKVADDSNACATAGGAELSLQWQGDRVALKDIHRQKAGACGEPPASIDWHPFR